jgi:hypothetical protein
VGVLAIAHGPTLEIVCARETNSSCPLRPDGQVWNGNPVKYHLPDLDYLGKPQRVFNLASDVLYGDIYAEVINEKGEQQLIRAHSYDLSLRDVRNMHVDQRAVTGLLPPLLPLQGRLVPYANAALRLVMPEVLGSLPMGEPMMWSTSK